MKKLFKVTGALPFAAIALVINPLWITSCEEKKQAEFTQADMVGELAEAVRTYTLEGDEGVFTLELAVDGLDAAKAKTPKETAHLGASFVQTAAACGHHEQDFVLGASACVDTFETTLTFKGKAKGTWAPKDGKPVAFEHVVSVAEYKVYGSKLGSGQIRFKVTDGDQTLDVALLTETGDGADFELKMFDMKAGDVAAKGGSDAGFDVPRF